MTRRVNRTLLLMTMALGAVAANAPHEAAGASKPAMKVSAQRGGLRLELSLSHASYPRDALIRAWVTMRNTTRHTIWVEGGGPQAPGKYFPQIDVLDSAGRSLPLSLTTWFPYPGPPNVPSALAPGQTIAGPEDIVLRGSWVRLGVTLLPNGNLPMRSRDPFHTPALEVALLPSDAPAVQLSAGTDRPVATIARPAYAHGLPQAVWYADCGGTNFDQRIYWTPVSTRLLPGCLPLHAWHVLVGWRGHSVATVEVPTS